MSPKELRNIVFLDNCANFDVSKLFLKAVPSKGDDSQDTVEVIYTHFSRIHYDKFPELKVVLCPASGVSHLYEDKPDNVKVIYLDNEAELMDRAVSSAEWGITAMLNLLLKNQENLLGKKIGFVGFSRMAQQIAKRLNCFNVDMKYFDPDTNLPLYISDKLVNKVSKVKLIYNNSDIIFVGLPDDTIYTNFIDEVAFAEMSRAYFINSFRGHLVDGLALVDAFDSGNLRGLAIDDMSSYAVNVQSQLIVLNKLPPNVIASQYEAGKGLQSRINTDMLILDKLQKFIAAG
jgi:phosphoglycerate dehydrogenase-like enzyme